MADDWGEVVTRQPLGNQRLDHLLSKDDISFRKIKCPDFICHYLVLRDQVQFFQIYYDDRLNRILDCVCYKQFEIHNPKSKGPVAQLGQSARLISVRSMVQLHPGPPPLLLIWGCSSAGRAPALHAGGHRFEPVHLHFNLRLLIGRLISSLWL